MGEFFTVGVFFPLLCLCFWRIFHHAVSPYPMLANIVIVLMFHHIVGGRVQRFIAEALPLELYHTPKWFLCMLRCGSRGMGTSHLIAEKQLKAAAERRASKLRATIMERNNDAAPSETASSVESGARRHLQMVAMDG